MIFIKYLAICPSKDDCHELKAYCQGATQSGRASALQVINY